MRVGVDALDDAVALGDDGDARVARHDALHAGADQRRLGAQQRHRLALHVRAHEGAVGVVVLEERDQRRRDRDQLVRRDVHELDLLGRAPCVNSPPMRAETRSRGERALARRAARSPAR